MASKSKPYIGLEKYISELLLENAKLREIIRKRTCKEFLELEEKSLTKPIHIELEKLKYENQTLRERYNILENMYRNLEKKYLMLLKENENLRKTLNNLSSPIIEIVRQKKCYELITYLQQANLLETIQYYLETGETNNYLRNKLIGDDIFFEIDSCKDIILLFKPQYRDKITWII